MASTKKARAAVADDLLSDEEIAAAAEAAEAIENVEEVDVEAAVAEVEKEEAKAKTYSKSKAAKSKASKRATPKGKSEKAPAAPRMSLETHPASEIITTRLGSDHHALFDLDGSKKATAANLRKTQTSVLERIDTLDKKSREKAINLFTSLAAEKRPSVYTVAACRFLAKEGQFTLKSLTDHFLAAGYQIGTARRQAGEMVALFPVVAIGTKAAERGSPVVYNEASTLAKAILALTS